jgi:hypothetical protein
MDFVHGATGQKNSSPVRSEGKRSAGVGSDMPEPLKWYDDNADNGRRLGFRAYAFYAAPFTLARILRRGMKVRFRD